MSECQLARFEYEGSNLVKKIYSCSEVRDLHEAWRKEFVNDNGSIHVGKRGIKDRHYEEFCAVIDNFLNQCKCIEDLEKCSKCPESHHEKWACRCESRNIRVAKERRSQGKVNWIKNE